MPTVAEVPFNIDELLAPIPGGDPAGPASAYYELRPQFEEMRREVTPDRDSPVQTEVKAADWRGVERKAREALTETSKDLRVACYLMEALVKTNGFAGAHDGMKLLRLLVEQCWDRLNPPLDPEDAEVRAGPFNWIDDPNFGLRFPTTLRLAPLLIGPDRSYSFNDCRPPDKDSAAQGIRAEVDRAAATVPPANLSAALQQVQGAQEELKKLTEGLSAKLGAAAPAMNAVRQVLEECRIFLEQILQKRPDAATKSDKEAVDGAPAASPGAAASARKSIASSNRPRWRCATSNRTARSRI